MEIRMKTIARSRILGIFAAFGLLLASGALHATDIVSNTNQTSTGAGGINYSSWAAFGFVTDASAYEVSDVSLSVELNAATNFDALQVYIYSSHNVSSEEQPFTSLATFGGTGNYSFNSGDNTWTFNLASAVPTLDANTLYWVVLGVDNGDFVNTYSWDYAGSLTASAGTVYPAYGNGTINGAEWSVFSTTEPYMAKVTGTSVVPEPSTYVLIGAGLAMLAILRLRRRSA